jgi:hypothetical protein
VALLNSRFGDTAAGRIPVVSLEFNMNKIRNVGAALSLAALAVPAAFAQAVDPFDTVLADVTTKVETYGGSLLVLAGVGVVLMIGMKYIKKLRGAA